MGTSLVHVIYEIDIDSGKLHGRYEERCPKGYLVSTKYYMMGIPCDTWTYYHDESHQVHQVECYTSLNMIYNPSPLIKIGALHSRHTYTRTDWTFNTDDPLRDRLTEVEHYDPTTGKLRTYISFYPASGRWATNEYYDSRGFLSKRTSYADNDKHTVTDHFMLHKRHNLVWKQKRRTQAKAKATPQSQGPFWRPRG